MFETKDTENTQGTKSPEPEVVEAVKKQIEAIGDNHKKQHDLVMKNVKEVRDLVDRAGEDIPADLEQKITRFTEDITTRQQAIDKKADEEKAAFTKRMDDFEVSLRRPGQGVTDKDDKDLVKITDEAKQFFIQSAVVRDKDEKGLSYKRMQNFNIDVDAYKAYCPIFEKFIRTDEKFLGPEDMRSLSVGIDPDGGYTVTPQFSNTVIARSFESDPIRQLASNESITTGAIEWMVDWGEAGYGWEGETETGDETETPQWKKKRIPVHVMYAKPRATQTLLEDSGINVENWLANKVSDRFMRAEGAAFVTGDGVGKPRGFLTYDSGINYGQIEQTNMGGAAALTADGFHDVKMSLIEYYLNRGTWLMNRTTVGAALKLKDGAGVYIWQPGLEPNMPSNILGLPVRMSTTMPEVAANALSVALADWRDSYMVVDRLGISVQRDPYTAKPFIEFYTRKRVGGDVTNYQALKIGKIAA